MHFELACWKGV